RAITQHEDYYSFFGLTSSSFSLIPNPKIFFPAKAHLECIEVLSFALNQGSLISVLTGEPGLGKTQVVLTLFSKLDQNIKPLYVLHPGISPLELYSSLAEELNWSVSFGQKSKDGILKVLKNNLLEIQKSFQSLLIIIDEAQLLPLETLEELRLLTNLTGSENISLQIFLIGQPLLGEKLNQPNLSPLRQRISIWEELKPLEKEEVLPYIWFRIKQVSQYPTLNILENIKKPLYKYTKGVPRLINKLMERTFLIAFFRKEKTIHKTHIKTAYNTFKKEIF
ncbi:MAG: ExeA family protein, partial [Caldimicrobium sp.]